MKRKYLIIIAVALLIANFAAAQVSSPNFFKKAGSAINFIQSSWELGSGSSRIAKGWFTALDSTSATIGSLQISSSINPGPLSVSASSNPDIRFTGDPNTGISWIDADRMALMTGGTNRLTVNSSGNVGIGTTSPLTKLDIGGGNLSFSSDGAWVSGASPQMWKNSNLLIFSGGTSGFQFRSSANSEQVTINSTGNVGIGTTSPQQKLEINGGLRLNTATAKPTCAVGIRGTIWYVAGGAGVADTVEACTKDASDVYAWRALY